MDPTALQAFADPTSNLFVFGRYTTSTPTIDSTAQPFTIRTFQNADSGPTSLDERVAEVMESAQRCGMGTVDASMPAGQADEDDWSDEFEFSKYVNFDPEDATPSQLDPDTANASSNFGNVTDASPTCALVPPTESNDEGPRPPKRARFDGDTDVTTPRTADADVAPTGSSSPHKGRLRRQTSRNGISFVVRPPQNACAELPLDGSWVENLLGIAEYYSSFITETGVPPPGVPAELHAGLLEVWTMHCRAIGPIHNLETCDLHPISGAGGIGLGDLEGPAYIPHDSKSSDEKKALDNEEGCQGRSDEAEPSSTTDTADQEPVQSSIEIGVSSTDEKESRARQASLPTSSQILFISSEATQTPSTSFHVPKGYSDFSYGQQRAVWGSQRPTMDLNSTSSSSSSQFGSGSPTTYGCNNAGNVASGSTPQPTHPGGTGGATQQPAQAAPKVQQEKHVYPLLPINPHLPDIVTTTNEELIHALDAYASLPDDKGGLPLCINGAMTNWERQEDLSKQVHDYRLVMRLKDGARTHMGIQRMLLANGLMALAGQAGSPTGASTGNMNTNGTTVTTTTATHDNNLLYTCGWAVEGYTKCGAYLPSDESAIQLHYEIFHAEARAWSGDVGKCGWISCGRPVCGTRMAKHTMGHHVGPNAKYRVCDESGCLSQSKGNPKCNKHGGGRAV